MALFHVYHQGLDFNGELKTGIDSLRVIDSWSADCSLLEASEQMNKKLQEYANTYGDGEVQLIEVDGDYSAKLPKAEVDFLIDMSLKSLPASDDDESYHDAMNEYLDLLAKRWPLYFDDRSEFAEYCSGATPEEMFEMSRDILHKKLKVLPPYIKFEEQQRTWESSYEGRILMALGFVFKHENNKSFLFRQLGKKIIKLQWITQNGAGYNIDIYEEHEVLIEHHRYNSKNIFETVAIINNSMMWI